MPPAPGLDAEAGIARTPGGRGGSIRDLLRHIDQGIVVLDDQLELVLANGSARSILAAASEEEAAGTIARSCPRGIFEKCRSGESAVTYLDVALPDRESRKLLGLEVRTVNVPAEGRCFYILIHDFSRWKRLDEMRSKFATSLSHRMRTPLTAVRNAVKILSEQPLGKEEKERLLDIGWRNVEKLISNLDELQKIFMIESEETNVLRTLVRIRGELNVAFGQLESEGKLKGCKNGMPDMPVFTGRGMLREFVCAAVDAYNTWLGETPFLECSSSVRDELTMGGVAERRLRIYLRPRTSSWNRTVRDGLRDYLSYHEAHRGLVLERLADALDGEIDVSPGNTISIILPLDPLFDREKDLVNPLQMMVQRTELTGSELVMVDLRMIGDGAESSRHVTMMERVMSSFVSENHIISKGEQDRSWAHFISGLCREDVEEVMQGIHDKFVEACRMSGEERISPLKWSIRYSRTGGDCIASSEVLVLD